jgi:hypothetical protein
LGALNFDGAVPELDEVIPTFFIPHYLLYIAFIGELNVDLKTG